MKPSKTLIIFVALSACSSAYAATQPFAGRWAVGQEACKIQESYTITARDMKDDMTGTDHCRFTSINQAGTNSWSVDAVCGASENITFKFSLSDGNLNVTGGYKSQSWVRCN